MSDVKIGLEPSVSERLGPTGPTGPAGSGSTGSTGPSGPTGSEATGPTGPVGGGLDVIAAGFASPAPFFFNQEGFSSITRQGVGEYTLTLTDTTANNLAVIITPGGGAGSFATASVSGPPNTKILVTTFGDVEFSVIVVQVV